MKTLRALLCAALLISVTPIAAVAQSNITTDSFAEFSDVAVACEQALTIEDNDTMDAIKERAMDCSVDLALMTPDPCYIESWAAMKGAAFLMWMAVDTEEVEYARGAGALLNLSTINFESAVEACGGSTIPVPDDAA